MWFFRLPYWAYMVLGALFFPLSWVVYSGSNDRAVDYAKAMEIGPPAMVELGAFDKSKDIGLLDEVVIRAQLDMSLRYNLTRTKNGTVRDRAFMMALYPVDAQNNTSPPVGLIWETRKGFSPETLADKVVGEGIFGPIIELHGKHERMGRLSKNAKGAFEEQNRAYLEAALKVVINPFEKPRSEELKAAPLGYTELATGCGIGVLLIGFGLFKRRRQVRT